MKKWMFFLLCTALAALCSPVGAVSIKNKTFIDASYSDVKTIKVVQTCLQVRVVKSQSDKTAVKCFVGWLDTDAQDFRIAARTVGSTLEIYQEPRSGSFRNCSGSIDIAVPAGVRVVLINSVSGSVSVEGLSLDNLNLASVSGSVTVRNTSASDFSASSVSGGVRIDGVKSPLVVLKSTSGSVNLSNCSGNKVDASSVSGSIRAENADFSLVSFSSTSGGISAYLGEGAKQGVFKSVSGGIRLYLKAGVKENKYDLGSVSGSLTIQGLASARRGLKMDLGDRVDIRANTVSGSITIGSY